MAKQLYMLQLIVPASSSPSTTTVRSFCKRSLGIRSCHSHHVYHSLALTCRGKRYGRLVFASNAEDTELRQQEEEEQLDDSEPETEPTPEDLEYIQQIQGVEYFYIFDFLVNSQ